MISWEHWGQDHCPHEAPHYIDIPSFGVSELRKGEGARGWFKLLTHGEAEYYNVPVIAEEEHVKAHIRKLKVEKWVASFFLR